MDEINGSSEFRRILYGCFLGSLKARCFGVAKTE